MSDDDGTTNTTNPDDGVKMTPMEPEGSITTDDAGRPLEDGGLYTLVCPLEPDSFQLLWNLETYLPRLRSTTAVQFNASVKQVAIGFSDDRQPTPIASGAAAVRELLPALDEALDKLFEDKPLPVVSYDDGCRPALS